MMQTNATHARLCCMRARSRLRMTPRLPPRPKLPQAASFTASDMPADHAEKKAQQAEEDGDDQQATDDLRGAPEWVKLVAIVATSALVAVIELVVCKRACPPPVDQTDHTITSNGSCNSASVSHEVRCVCISSADAQLVRSSCARSPATCCV